MDFKNWLLLFLITGVIGYFAIYIYNNSPSDSINRIAKNGKANSENARKAVAGDNYERPSDWEKYSGDTLEFYHPAEWVPENEEPFGGAIIESVNLNIPKTNESYLFYSAAPLDVVKPEDLKKENKMDIGEKEWTEWIRENNQQVSYDLFTKESMQGEKISFGVHVAVEEENNDLENELVDFIHTIKFDSNLNESSPSAENQ